MNISKKIFYFLVLLTSFSFNSFAQNYNDAFRLSEPGIFLGARALGMGNGFSAIGNDFSAALFNPAGLGLIKKAELIGGFNLNSFNNKTNFFNNTRSGAIDQNLKLGEFGVVIPVPTIQGSFVVALVFNQPKIFNSIVSFNGFNPNNNSYIQDLTDFNDDIAFKLALSYPLYDSKNNYLRDTTRIKGKLNQRGTYQQNGFLNNWNAAGAIEVEKDIFVGATISIYSGEFNKTKDYYEEDVNNNYPSSLLLDPIEPTSADFKSFYLNDKLIWDISGYGFNIGGLIKLNEIINIAANIKFAKNFTVKESYVVDAESLFGNNNRFTFPRAVDIKSEYEIRTPAEYTLALASHNGNLELGASVTIIDYRSAKFKSGFSTSSIQNKNADIYDLFRPTYNLNVGVEYKIPSSKVTVRGGIMVLQSPFKDDTIEYDKKFLTVGIGYRLTNKFTVDGAFAYGWWKDLGDNYGSGLSRTYQDIKNQNFIFSIKYNY
jgi:hypothetical protein